MRLDQIKELETKLVAATELWQKVVIFNNAAETIEAKSVLFQIHQALAELYKQQGDFAQALAHYEQFHILEKEVFNEQTGYKLKASN